MRTYTSHGEPIQVELRVFGAFLWLCFGIVVRVQGRTFYPKLTGIRLKVQTEFDFDADGKRISGVVRTLNPLWFRRVRFAVFVENSEIARDVEPLERWYLSYFAWAIVGCVLILASLGAVVAAIVISKLLSR
jgi:hypothetical protein